MWGAMPSSQHHEFRVHWHESVSVRYVSDDVPESVGRVPPVGAHLGAVVVTDLLRTYDISQGFNFEKRNLIGENVYRIEIGITKV